MDMHVTADKFDNLLHAKLRASSLQADDLLHALPLGSLVSRLLMCGSAPGQRDIALTYLAVPRDAPEYANVDRELQITLGSAIGTLHLDTWLYLFDTMLAFVDALDIKE